MGYANRAKDLSLTIGTGNFTLANEPPIGFVALSDDLVIGELFDYTILNSTLTEWEVGRGKLLDAVTLERTTVFKSTNADALVNFSSGIKVVFNALTAESFEAKQDALVSGTNIKTINGTSVLGSGNITIVADSPVDSVNGQIGDIVLNSDDIAEGSTNKYFTESRVLATILSGLSTASNTVVNATHSILQAIGFLQKQVSDNKTTADNHIANTANPHAVTKAQVGLGNVDNTSDVNKPVSTAQAAADTAVLNTIRNGVNSAGDDLAKLYDLIQTLNSIVGGTSPDGDSIVDTVAELLAVFATYPEGADLATVLNGKIETSAIINTLTEVTSGKVLDARQGKALKDLIDALSASNTGTNTGDETVQRIGTLINSATAKNTPIDADMIGLMDSASSNILKKLSWLNLKASLKTYFDTIYTLALLGGVSTTRTVNSQALSADVVLTTANIADSTNKRYVSDADVIDLANLSGTNTGDNAVNSLYSGLAASKQDVLVSATNIKTINGSSILGTGNLIISGSGGIAGSVTVNVDFGLNEDSLAITTVTGQTWVTPSMKWLKNAITSTDHSIDETAVECVNVQIANVVNGDGFDLIATAPNGTWGIHTFEIAGI